jgi:hypothetical protein
MKRVAETKAHQAMYCLMRLDVYEKVND